MIEHALSKLLRPRAAFHGSRSSSMPIVPQVICRPFWRSLSYCGILTCANSTVLGRWRGRIGIILQARSDTFNWPRSRTIFWRSSHW